MKKFTKFLALILVCGAFMLTGCGLSLDVSGNYKEINEDEYTKYLETATYTVSGYEFEATAKAKDTSYEYDTSIKGKVLYDAEGNITGMYYEESITQKSSGAKETATRKLYIKDGKFYQEVTEGGETSKTYRTQQSSDSSYITSYIKRFVLLKDMHLYTEEYASEVKYSKAEKSGYTKFKMEPKTFADDVSGKCNVWVVFKDAKAYGLKQEVDIKKSDSYTEKLTIVSKLFDGKISYPSFDGFSELA